MCTPKRAQVHTTPRHHTAGLSAVHSDLRCVLPNHSNLKLKGAQPYTKGATPFTRNTHRAAARCHVNCNASARTQFTGTEHRAAAHSHADGRTQRTRHSHRAAMQTAMQTHARNTPGPSTVPPRTSAGRGPEQTSLPRRSPNKCAHFPGLLGVGRPVVLLVFDVHLAGLLAQRGQLLLLHTRQKRGKLAEPLLDIG